MKESRQQPKIIKEINWVTMMKALLALFLMTSGPKTGYSAEILSQSFHILKNKAVFKTPDDIVSRGDACMVLRDAMAAGDAVAASPGLDFAVKSLGNEKISVTRLSVKGSAGETFFLSSPLGIVEHGLLCDADGPGTVVDTFHMRGNDNTVFTYPTLGLHFRESGTREVLVLFHSSLAPLIPVTWMREGTVSNFKRYDIFLYVLLAGGLLGILLYNTFLWLGAGKEIYKYNVAYVATMMVFNLSFGHFYGLLMAGVDPSRARYVAFFVEMAGNLASFASGALVLLFFVAYLGEGERRMRWFSFLARAVGRFGLYVGAGSMVAPLFNAGNLFGQVARPYATLTALLMLFGLLWATFVCRRKAAGLFLLAYAPLIAGVSFYVPFLEGSGEGTVFARNAMLLGSFVESVLLSFVVGYRQKLVEEEALAKTREYSERLRTLNDELEVKVENKTQNIKSILASVNQGLVTVEVTADGRVVIGEEQSAKTKTVIGRPLVPGDLLSTALLGLSEMSEEDKSKVNMTILTSVGSPVLNFELNAHILPQAMDLATQGEPKYLRLYWDPVEVKGVVTRFVLTMIDATSERADAKASTEYEESMRVVIAAVQKGERVVVQSLSEALFHAKVAEDAVSSLREGAMTELKRRIHTTKGLARSAGLADMASQMHSLEDDLEIVSGDLALIREVSVSFSGAVESIVATVEHFLGWRVERLEGSGALRCERLTDLLMLPISSAQAAAASLGKPRPEVDLIGLSHIEADAQVLAALREAMVHVLTNAVDHGLESRGEREAAGKPGAGKISVRTEESEAGYVITVEDDGRGLNLEALRAKLAGRGKTGLSDADVVDSIFESDLSTKETVSAFSGRGVGMGAVRAALREMGGEARGELTGKENGGKAPLRIVLSWPKRTGSSRLVAGL